MRPYPVVLSTLLCAGVLAVPASADTVRFKPGEGTSITDGKITCVMGVSQGGAGSVRCSGPRVSDEWGAKTDCEIIGNDGTPETVDGMRAIGLRERGRNRKEAICGVGGALDVERGDKVILGDIKGERLQDGGFRFRNRDGHGFTLTARALTRV
jgi:hypothetical protein